MDSDSVTKVTKLSREEAQAFRDRVKKQNKERSTWVVVNVDEFLDLFAHIMGP